MAPPYLPFVVLKFILLGVAHERMRNVARFSRRCGRNPGQLFIAGKASYNRRRHRRKLCQSKICSLADQQTGTGRLQRRDLVSPAIQKALTAARHGGAAAHSLRKPLPATPSRKEWLRPRTELPSVRGRRVPGMAKHVRYDLPSTVLAVVSRVYEVAVA